MAFESFFGSGGKRFEEFLDLEKQPTIDSDLNGFDS